MDTNINTEPKVSIIMPTYNRANYIVQAIESIQKQTYSHWELIIIDDASTDDTASVVNDCILKDPRIRYIRQPKNVGISYNRNYGIRNSTGKYIAMLDSDDVWSDPAKLSMQLHFLETHQEYALVGTSITVIDSNGAPVNTISFYITDAKIRRHILRRNQFAQSSVVFTRSILDKIQTPHRPYDESLVVAEDYDLWLAIGAKANFANLPTTTTMYRIHEGSIMRQKKVLAARAHLQLIKKYRHVYPAFFRAYIKARIRIALAHL